MIVKVSGGFKIRSHKTGKLYPKVYTSREAIQARINQMEQFKHMNKSISYVILKKGRSIKEWKEYLRIDKPEKAHPSDNISSIGKSKKEGPQSLKDVLKARTVGAKDKKSRKKKLSKKRIDKLKEIERKAQLTFPFVEKLSIGR
jgi:predicted DNA-binding protein